MDWKVLAMRPTEAKWISPLAAVPRGRRARGEHQASTEQKMLSALVMNVGPTAPGGDPGTADKWIPNAVGRICEWLVIKGSEEKPG